MRVTTTITRVTTTTTEPAAGPPALDPPGSSVAAPTVRVAILAVYAVFALVGVQFAAFASRIPQIKALLDLTPGELGVTLLAASAGSVLGLPAAGWLAHRFGATRSACLRLCSIM